MNEEKKKQFYAELNAMTAEMTARDDAIVREYKRTHKIPGRGTINPPERRALRAEEKRRYFEIKSKYADED